MVAIRAAQVMVREIWYKVAGTHVKLRSSAQHGVIGFDSSETRFLSSGMLAL
jgi:hypothetical protein